MPSEPVIVFDGVCRLCSRWVRFVLRNDLHARFKLVSMQSAIGRELLAGSGLDPDDPASFLLLEDGRQYTDTDALTRVLAGLGPRRWRLVARVIEHMPRPLRDRGYRWIARNRYRIFGRRAFCQLPDPAFRGRFLD